MKKNENLVTLDDFINKEYGYKENPKRDKFEQDFQVFKLNTLLNEASKSKGTGKSPIKMPNSL